MKRLATRAYPYLITVVLAILGVPLIAQTTQEQPPPDKVKQQKKATQQKKPKVTEEVTVTARHREETVQSVPESVAAPTESDLRDRGAENLEDVSANVAGFTVQNLGPGQSQVAMRGVSSGQIVRDQPGVKEQVGIYLDDSVVSLSLFTPDLDLFDLNRVEVLRGPQGTLFGSGSESGTVRYITNQPVLNESETIGEFNAEDIQNGGPGGSAKAAVNVPIGTTAAVRFVGYYTRYGGFMNAVQPNLSVKKDVNDGFRSGTRIAYLYKPNDKLSITPRILYQRVHMNGWNRIDVYNILGNPYTTTRPAVQLGDHRQFTQITEPFTDDFLLGDVNLKYELSPAMTFSSITSYNNRGILVQRDAGALTSSITGGSIGLPPQVYTLNAPLLDRTHAHMITEEARVSGETGKLQWLGGVFYGHVNRHYGQNLPVTGFTAISGIPSASIYAPTDSLFWSNLDYHFNQYAIFGEGTYSVTPRLDLTGGVRFYNYHEDRTQIFDGLFGEDANGNPQSQPGSVHASGFAPRVIASYKVTDTTQLNAQISKGFRLGGINDPLNVTLCTAADLVTFGGRPTWKDETLWNYEVGSKTTLQGGRGAFNASAFYADIRNLQATVTAGSCSSRIVFNVPKSRSAGVEVEYELAPSDRYDFAISATHTNSRVESTLTSTDAQGNVSVVAGIQKGNRLPTVPENQGAAALTLHWPTDSGWAGYATGVLQYVGTRYTQIGDQAAGFGAVNLYSFAPNNIGGPYTQNTFTFNPLLPAYTLVNLRVGILRGRWDTALYVNNLTDERALLALDQERGTRARVSFLTNQPRTFGITTRVDF